MSDESNDYGFGSFVRHDEPTMQTPAPIAAQKSIGSSVKERKLSKPSNAAETATSLAKDVGPARAANITPITQDPGFQKDAATIGLTGLGLGAIGLASIFGAGYYMGKKGKASSPEIDRTIDIPMGAAPTTAPAPTTQAPPPVHKDAPLLQAGLENTAANALNQQVQTLQKAGAVPGSAAPVAAPQPVAPAPVQPTISQAVATGQNPTQAIETEVAKQIEAPVVEEKKRVGKKPGRKTAEEKAAIAAAIPPSEVGLTKQQLGLKRHLESFYGGGDVGAQAYQQVKNILGYTPEYPPGKGGGLQPEETSKILQYRKENIPGPKVNLTHDMKKALKAGGGAAILAAIPGFAEAKNLQEFGRNVGEALLPIGMTPSELAPGTLYTPQQQREFTRQLEAQRAAERQKLGSPYRSVPPPR